MPLYRFEALQANGHTQEGTLEAEHVAQAKSQLRARGWVPLSVQALQEPVPSDAALPWWRRPLGPARQAFPAGQRALFIRQLAELVASGLTLERALAALIEDSTALPQRTLLAHVRAQVQGGQSLGQALGQFPREFPEVDLAVIAAGEQTGQLALVLRQLATDLEAQQNLQGKLLSAALYPAIVSAIALAIVVFLLTSVVPQVAGVFASQQQALPLLTRFMLGLSQGLHDWGGVGALGLLGAALLGRRALAQPALRLRWDAAALRWPVLGPLARAYNSARFAATLGLLSAAGVPILKALETAAQTLSNHALRADALQALELVREGAPLALALGQQARFSTLLTLFARLGEQTGQLPTMLQRAADQLGQQVQRRALALATVLEPLLIVLMGAVVMVIVLAVLLPIMEINQWVR